MYPNKNLFPPILTRTQRAEAYLSCQLYMMYVSWPIRKQEIVGDPGPRLVPPVLKTRDISGVSSLQAYDAFSGALP